MSSRISKAGKISWHLVDAQGQIVGRLANRIAPILRGKHKPTYSPNVDCGDHVVVINASQVEFTGNKWEDKLYRWHTGYLGGLKQRRAKEMLEKKPEQILRSAVDGMLPKNKMRKLQNIKLHIFPNEDHPFQKELDGKTSLF